MTTLTAEQVTHHLTAARDRPILVLGDVMLDRYLWGNVHRISPEAPVPIVDVESETVRLGGAANVAHNVAALGARPILVAVTGEDHPASLLRAELASRGIKADGLVADAGRPTSIKTRIVARHQQVVRADQESREEITGQVEDRILAVVRERMAGLAACILSDYGKGVITRRLLDALLPEFRAAGVPVCVDPKETHFFGYSGVSVITPNLLEAGVAFGRALRTDELIEQAGRELREKLGCHAVLITRGERGMSLFEAGRPRLDLPTVAREVYDVTGAGDTVISAYAALLAAGASHPVAAEIANHAAGIVVREVGTATATPEAIVASFASGADVPVVALEALLPLMAEARAAGRRIVFTNGVFDLLHRGHVTYLEEARALGDLLVVGLNSDDSVRRLKGPDRPVNRLDDRAHLLAALRAVDYVVPFEDDTPLGLIEAITPDILVKGGDYRAEDVVGGEWVRSHGGQVNIAQTVTGFSTTGLIQSLKPGGPQGKA